MNVSAESKVTSIERTQKTVRRKSQTKTSANTFFASAWAIISVLRCPDEPVEWVSAVKAAWWYVFVFQF